MIRNILNFLFVVACLLIPVSINGFPFVFTDTFYYLQTAQTGVFSIIHPTFYAFIWRTLTFTTDPWCWLFLQISLSAIFLLFSFQKLANGKLSGRAYILFAAVVLCTPLALETNLLLPDFMAGQLVLALFILCFCENLSWREKSSLFLFVTLAAAIHLSYLPLIVFCVACAFAIRAFLGVSKGRFMQRSLILLSIVTLVASGIILQNYRISGRPALSLISSQMLFARFYADGVLDEFLAARCQLQQEEICTNYKNLKKESDWILWYRESPLKISTQAHLEREDRFADILRSAAYESPVDFIQAFLSNAFLQFLSTDSHRILSIPGEARFWYPALLGEVMNGENREKFYNSLQARSSINYGALNLLFRALYLVPLFIFLLALFLKKTNAFEKKLILFVLCALLINAALTGGLSLVAGRYQLRVAWLPAFVLIAILARRRQDKSLAI